ncbi:single-stranded DNA-binding protein [Dactylosporangium sp. CS-047395]|uniref:single-stranded DNA-binding protein n=1 Tax=Dactylosporangium sp. CS-047395 TaxID=3239936 RepID=UPI003D8BB147
MFETMVTITGNVLTPPESRRVVDQQTLVTHFKVASTSRRFDRADTRWVDGDSLRLRVNCWRQLADNVARSVQLGDPVIVIGRLYSRDWETEDHVRRVSYEIDAQSVGHDLSRGRAKFARVRALTATDALDDDRNDARHDDPPTEPADEINGLPRRKAYDPDLGGVVTLIEDGDPFAEEILASLTSDGDLASVFETPAATVAAAPTEITEITEESADEEVEPEDDEAEPEAGPSRAKARRQRPRVPAGV